MNTLIETRLRGDRGRSCGKRYQPREIYLIVEKPTGLSKIGVSINPEGRRCALAASSGRKLTLVKTWDCKSGSLPIEKRLHRALGEYQVQGEWYTFRPKSSNFWRQSMTQAN